MAEDCYFFVDMDKDVPDEQRTMSVLCVPCHDQHYPQAGWFWPGSENGYGPWEYKCCVCGKNVNERKRPKHEKAKTPS